VIRHPTRLQRAFPVTVLLRLPVPCATVERRFQHGSVSGFPLRCLRSCRPSSTIVHRQERLGLPKFCDVSLPACHGLRTPADLPNLANSVALVLPSGAFKPSASAIAMSKLYQHFRVRGHPCGLQDTLSTLRPSCSSCVRPQLRHGRQTRYGWGARPYPTRTYTLQETPSLSWRDNGWLQARCGAQRSNVACKPLLGGVLSSGTSMREQVTTESENPDKKEWVVLENNNGCLTQLSVEGLPLCRLSLP